MAKNPEGLSELKIHSKLLIEIVSISRQKNIASTATLSVVASIYNLYDKDTRDKICLYTRIYVHISLKKLMLSGQIFAIAAERRQRWRASCQIFISPRGACSPPLNLIGDDLRKCRG